MKNFDDIDKAVEKISGMNLVDFTKVIKDFRSRYASESRYPAKVRDIIFRDFVVGWNKWVKN